MPSCRELDVEEIVTKSIGAVTFTTSIIETIELAYPCNAGGADAAAKQARCAAWNVPVEQSGVQCRCSHSEMYYVKGIERMGVAFEHAYTTTEMVNGGLAGSSAVVGEKLDTKVHWSNGTQHECTPRHLALPRHPETKPSFPSPPMHHVAHPQWRVHPADARAWRWWLLACEFLTSVPLGHVPCMMSCRPGGRGHLADARGADLA